jgi:hypothetical protein
VRARAVGNRGDVVVEVGDLFGCGIRTKRSQPPQQDERGIAGDIFQILGCYHLARSERAELTGDDRADQWCDALIEQGFEMALGVCLALRSDVGIQQGVEHREGAGNIAPPSASLQGNEGASMPRLLTRVPRVAIVVLPATLLFVPARGEGQLNIRPGEWEFEIQLNFSQPGVAAAGQAVLEEGGFKNQKRRECLTAEDVKEANFAKRLAAEMADMNCTHSPLKTSGNKTTFTMTCKEEGITVTMTNELTFSGDSFVSVTTGKDSMGNVFGGRLTARRIGVCTKEP